MPQATACSSSVLNFVSTSIQSPLQSPSWLSRHAVPPLFMFPPVSFTSQTLSHSKWAQGRKEGLRCTKLACHPSEFPRQRRSEPEKSISFILSFPLECASVRYRVIYQESITDPTGHVSPALWPFHRVQT